MFSSNYAAIRALTQLFDEEVFRVDDESRVDCGERVSLHPGLRPEMFWRRGGKVTTATLVYLGIITSPEVARRGRRGDELWPSSCRRPGERRGWVGTPLAPVLLLSVKCGHRKLASLSTSVSHRYHTDKCCRSPRAFCRSSEDSPRPLSDNSGAAPGTIYNDSSAPVSRSHLPLGAT